MPARPGESSARSGHTQKGDWGGGRPETSGRPGAGPLVVFCRPTGHDCHASGRPVPRRAAGAGAERSDSTCRSTARRPSCSMPTSGRSVISRSRSGPGRIRSRPCSSTVSTSFPSTIGWSIRRAWRCACPASIALKEYITLSRRPAFTRFNVFLRDRFSCQYCGDQLPASGPHLRPSGAALARRTHDLGQRGRGLQRLQPAQEQSPGAGSRHASAGEAPPADEPRVAGARPRLPAQLPARKLARFPVLGTACSTRADSSGFFTLERRQGSSLALGAPCRACRRADSRLAGSYSSIVRVAIKPV